jgi:hypothetical protein
MKTSMVLSSRDLYKISWVGFSQVGLREGLRQDRTSCNPRYDEKKGFPLQMVILGFSHTLIWYLTSVTQWSVMQGHSLPKGCAAG